VTIKLNAIFFFSASIKIINHQAYHASWTIKPTIQAYQAFELIDEVKTA
jgi:hypothetical protein